MDEDYIPTTYITSVSVDGLTPNDSNIIETLNNSGVNITQMEDEIELLRGFIEEHFAAEFKRYKLKRDFYNKTKPK